MSMIPAIGETRVSHLLAEQAAFYATLSDEDLALSETPAFDRAMRDWAKRCVEKTPEARANAHHGWPAEHRFKAECECWMCRMPMHRRGLREG